MNFMVVVRYTSQKCQQCGEDYSGESTICGDCMRVVDSQCEMLANVLRALGAGATAIVWQFQDAPVELQSLSSDGGDEDWLAFFPDQEIGNYAHGQWIKALGIFGITTEHLKHGAVVIGAHA